MKNTITIDIDNYDIKTKTAPKFEIGKEYAITFNPAFKLDSRIDSWRAFFMSSKNDAIMSDDASYFINPTSIHEQIVCKQTCSQTYTESCSIVYFKFVTYSEFVNKTYKNRLYENGIKGFRNNGILFYDKIGGSDIINYDNRAKSDQYIITDNASDISSIKIITIA